MRRIDTEELNRLRNTINNNMRFVVQEYKSKTRTLSSQLNSVISKYSEYGDVTSKAREILSIINEVESGTNYIETRYMKIVEALKAAIDLAKSEEREINVLIRSDKQKLSSTIIKDKNITVKTSLIKSVEANNTRIQGLVKETSNDDRSILNVKALNNVLKDYTNFTYKDAQGNSVQVQVPYDWGGKFSTEMLGDIMKKNNFSADDPKLKSKLDALAKKEGASFGIDCSGLVLRAINTATNGEAIKYYREIYPHFKDFSDEAIFKWGISADALTSLKNSKKITEFKDIQPGDYIRFDNGGHIGIVSKVEGNVIHYVHSSGGKGPHEATITVSETGKNGLDLKKNATFNDWSNDYSRTIQGLYNYICRPNFMIDQTISTQAPVNQANNNVNQVGQLKEPLSIKTKGVNEQVKELQKKLNELGYTDANGKKLTVDGLFGPNTLAAVNMYKNTKKIDNKGEYAGIVGNTTWGILMKDTVKLNKPGTSGNAQGAGNVNNISKIEQPKEPLDFSIKGWTIPENIRKGRVQQCKFIDEITSYVAKIQQETGIPWQVMIAQVCLESGYGKHEIKDINTGERSYNIFGIKYNANKHGEGNFVSARTTEEIKESELEKYKKAHPELKIIKALDNGNYSVSIIAKFAKFSSLESAFDKYKDILLNQYFKHALRSANDPITYIKDIQGELDGENHPRYATDSEYINKITNIMKTYGMLDGNTTIISQNGNVAAGAAGNVNNVSQIGQLKEPLSIKTKGVNEQVKELQKKLNELGYTDANGRKLVADGLFGPSTLAAVNLYKNTNKIDNKGEYAGVVGNTTWGILMKDKKKIESISTVKPENSSYTPTQGYDKVHINGQFGTMYYKPGEKSGPHTLIVRDPKWEAENLVFISIPKVIIDSGKVSQGATRLRVNKNVEEYWKKVLSTFEENPELLKYVTNIDPGTSYARYITGSTTTPSNHCWGTAIDINTKYVQGKKVDPTDKNHPQVILWEKVFKPAGFEWGNDFPTPDPMHFEITKFK